MTLSEDSYRTDLIQKLNTLLPNPYKAVNSLNITISKDDSRYNVLKKFRREFDVIILDDAFIGKKKVNIERIEFAIETKKLGSSISGINQAEDAFTAFPYLKVTYATNFQDFLYRRERNSFENNIPITNRNIEKVYDKIAKIISEDVNKLKDEKKETGSLTLNEREAIAMLKECMEKIQLEMIELPDESKLKMTERTLVMWKKYNETETDIIELEFNIKRAASYIIVDQFLFYHLLQKKSNFSLRELKEEEIDDEDDPDIFSTKYFKRAIKVTKDYRPVFEIDMLTLLPKTKRVIKALNEVIRTIKELKFEHLQTDILGKIFHSMIPSEIRKQIAAYYTGNAPARLLAELSIKKPNIIVGDLACGSGTLLMEAYNVKKRLYLEENPLLTEGSIHKEIISNELFGNDITLFATHLAMMNLCIQNLNEQVDRVNITSTDGLQVKPHKKMGSLMDFADAVHVDAFTIDGQKHSIIYPEFDLIIMNPPFSRQTGMDDSLLENLNTIAKEWWPDKDIRKRYINKRMGLHAYFLLHADRVIKKNGTIAMVLPSSTFTTDYSANILRFLSDKRYSIDFVIEILTKESTFSEDCNFREFMVILRKNGLKSDGYTRLISFLENFEIAEVQAILDAIVNNKNHPKFNIFQIETAKLYQLNKWTNIFSKEVNIINNLYNSDKLSKVINENQVLINKGNDKGKLKVEKTLNPSRVVFRSGYHGTYSRYLMLPNDIWEIEKINDDLFQLTNTQKPIGDQTRTCEINSKYLVEALRKSGDFNRHTASPNSYTLNLPYRLNPEMNNFRRNYLHWAEQQLNKKWEKAKKKGHKRVNIVIRPTFKKVKKKGKIISVIDEIPWYSHAYHNNCEKTISRLFVCKKYRGKTRKSLTILSNKLATVNHGSLYWIIAPNYEFYASWLTSSIFLYSLLNSNRTISLGYWEMMVNDFDKTYIPIYESFSNDEIKVLVKKWEKLSSLSDEDLPFLPQQFGSDYVKYNRSGEELQRRKFEPLQERIELDKGWLKVLKIPENEIDKFIESLYELIKNYMETR